MERVADAQANVLDPRFGQARQDGIDVLGASSIAGFFASFFSLPFDYVKTQLQKQKPLPDGTMPFKGFGDCVAKTMASGGPLKFYTGFPTYYVRIAPHAMFTLIILDQINAAQKAMGA